MKQVRHPESVRLDRVFKWNLFGSLRTYFLHSFWLKKFFFLLMSISTKQKQTRRYRGQTCACQGGDKDWEFEINRCEVVYLGWKNNNILLYRTGNCIPYPVINHNGKEHENIYMCILCCSSESTSTLACPSTKCFWC